MFQNNSEKRSKEKFKHVDPVVNIINPFNLGDIGKLSNIHNGTRSSVYERKTDS